MADNDTDQGFESAVNANFNIEDLTAELDKRFGNQSNPTNSTEEVGLEESEAEESTSPSLIVSNEEDESTINSSDDADNNESSSDSSEWQAPEYFELDPSTRIPRSAIETYIEFEQRLRNDPNFHQYLTSYTPPVEEVGPVPQPPQPPPDLDLDDPSVKFLWDQIQEQAETNRNLLSRLQAHDNVLTTQQQNTAESLINKATQSFQSYLDLTDSDMEKISGVATRMGTVATYMNGVHPLTGAPVQPDPLDALNLAFTMAYNSLPEFQKKSQEATITQITQDRNRKKKAGAVLGASGSVSRSTPAPKTEEDRRAAMIAEVAEMMNGGN